MQLGRTRDVQGAWFEIVPKRRSQVACGFAQSARDHWLLTLAFNSSASFFPLRRSKAGNKGSDVKLLSDWGYSSEERVSALSCFGAETEPPSPGPVVGLVAPFDATVKDDAAICSTDKTQEEISLGSGEILKLSGICSE
jgi:hypothetical protein